MQSTDFQQRYTQFNERKESPTNGAGIIGYLCGKKIRL